MWNIYEVFAEAEAEVTYLAMQRNQKKSSFRKQWCVYKDIVFWWIVFINKMNSSKRMEDMLKVLQKNRQP